MNAIMECSIRQLIQFFSINISQISLFSIILYLVYYVLYLYIHYVLEYGTWNISHARCDVRFTVPASWRC